MTKFTGPLIVGALDSDATAAVIDASGTATFQGDLNTTGTFNLTGSAIVSGSAVFTDRVQSGDSGQRGTATMVQRVTIATDTTTGAPATIVIPSGSDIIDFIVDIEEQFDTAAGATAANIEISGAGGATLAVIPVSASGQYNLAGANAGNAESRRNVTVTIEAHVSIQGSPTAMTVGQAMLSIVYVQN